MQHIKLLDGIRGFAIIFVMLYHFSINFQHQDELMFFDFVFAKVLQSGWLGVDLFFVMSGFLITSILYKSTESKNYLKNFYVRRFLRIFPLYYLILFIFIFVLPSLSASLGEDTKLIQENSFWFWTYLLNWRIAYLGSFNEIQAGYMWSLAVEEQFYLIWPFIVLYFRESLIKICMSILLCVISLKIYLFYFAGVNATSLYVMTITHLDGLLLGASLSVLYLNSGIDEKLKNSFKYVACFALLIIVVVSYMEGNFAFYSDYVSLFGVTACSVLFCYLLFTMLIKKEDGKLNKLFLSSPIIYMGKLCYGLYLVHHPIGILVSNKIISHDSFVLFGSYMPALVISMLISFVLSIIAAHLSYHFFEIYFLKLKNKFS